MVRALRVVTPENIPLQMELAGLGTRFGALLIDLAIILSSFVLLGIIGLILLFTLSGTGMETMIGAVLIIASFVLFFGYFIFFESVWDGQTPGKRALGLRVIADSGFPLTFFGAATRNLVRLVDLLPGMFGFGAIAVFCHPQYKRLGDMVAGTVVVKERGFGALRYGPAGPPNRREAHLENAHLLESVANPLEALSDAELVLLRRFTLRRWEMMPDAAERFAYRLLAPRLARLNVVFDPRERTRYADLATMLVRDADRREEERDAGLLRF